MSSDENAAAVPAAKPVVGIGDFVVGTIVPYAGVSDSGTLSRLGWLECDGRAVSRETYSELFSVTGTLHGGGDGVHTFNLPDFRGWFLRGVDDGAGRDPDAAHRTAAAGGGAVGDECGSAQGHATAPPKVPFVLTEDGTHTHNAPNMPDDNSSYHVEGSHQAEWNSGSAPVDEAGEHEHELVGGDPETRPLNAYVGYLIKYRV